MDDQTKNTIDKLWAVLINFEWFANRIEVNKNLHKSLIVYVDKMSKSILETVPDNMDGFDIQVHFISSINDKYAAKLPSAKSSNSLVDFVSLIETTTFEN